MDVVPGAVVHNGSIVADADVQKEDEGRVGMRKQPSVVGAIPRTSSLRHAALALV